MNYKQGSRIIKPKTSFSDTSQYFNKPRIMAISSGKGGVGKTSIALNLAITLSNSGKKVIIFDADLGLSNVDVMMGVYPNLTLHDCLKGRANISDIIITGPAGVELISGGSGFLELANLGDELLKNLTDSLHVLDSRADFIIVDTSAGISKNVLAFATAVEEFLLVLTPEPTSITDAYSLTKILSKYKLHDEIYLIINRAASTKEAEHTRLKFENVCERFLNIKVNYLGHVLEDRNVPEAIKSQQPLVTYKPSSPAAKCISKIASSFLESNKKSSGISSFFDRLTRLFRR